MTKLLWCPTVDFPKWGLVKWPHEELVKILEHIVECEYCIKAEAETQLFLEELEKEILRGEAPPLPEKFKKMLEERRKKLLH
jgi:hypothetical protein